MKILIEGERYDIEKLNKIYGTSIIISDEIYQVIKNQFLFRLLDCVAVKGKSKPIYVYEVLGDDAHLLSYDSKKYNEFFNQGYQLYQAAHFADAIQCFNKALLIYPDDKVTPLLIKRCQHFIENPPEHWDGVWRIVE